MRCATTGRGAAEINLFFNWSVDMLESLQIYLPSRIASNIDLASNAAGGLLAEILPIAGSDASKR